MAEFFSVYAADTANHLGIEFASREAFDLDFPALRNALERDGTPLLVFRLDDTDRAVVEVVYRTEAS